MRTREVRCTRTRTTPTGREKAAIDPIPDGKDDGQNLGHEHHTHIPTPDADTDDNNDFDDQEESLPVFVYAVRAISRRR